MIITRSPKKAYLKILLLTIVVLSILFVSSLYIKNILLWIAMVVIIALAIVSALIANIYYKSQELIVDDNGITLKQGILSIKKVIIPYEKIENVRTFEPITDRILKEATIVVDSAGTTDLEIVLKDIEKKDADYLVSQYHKNVKKLRGDSYKGERL